MSKRRVLHFVYKVGNRNLTIKFFRDVLGMKVLRHEEFEEGCKATCNGPYDGKWSKTMVGYGSEDNHFVAELTYNYGVSTYQPGNDFLGLTLHSTEIVDRARKLNWDVKEDGITNTLVAPGGYKFHIVNVADPPEEDPVKKVSLASSNLNITKDYWHGLLGMKIFEQNDKSLLLGYSDTQAKVEFIDIGCPVEHAKAFGRIAFSCPSSELPNIEFSMKEKCHKILTPLISLNTPGKATVQVVILADPDGHEICFVGDEAFRELSHLDSEAHQLLESAMESDKSDEWFAKKGKEKAAA